MNDSKQDDYGLSSIPESTEMKPPELAYLPPRPKNYAPNIGLIGAGGITEYHLRAYQRMGLNVSAICDLELDRADQQRADYYPDAKVHQDFRSVLEDDSIEVVDIATHPEPRVEIIKEAIRAKKHILSQKPFVVDLDVGKELVAMAAEHDVRLAINQNGRWAPHFAYITKAIHAGVIGDLSSVDFVLHWDHTWTAGTPFEEIHHLLLYDFAIHWFDISSAMLGATRPKSVYANIMRSSYQTVRPPFLASVIIDAEPVQVRILLNALVSHGQEDRTIAAGSLGTIWAHGPGINEQTVELATKEGHARPHLEGTWFENGFEGTMGELLCAIEEDRPAWNDAEENLRSLELCFKAIKSADSGEVVRW